MDVNSKNTNPSVSPLHIAVRNCDIETVKMILDQGADINAKVQYGRTPLHNAVKTNNMKVTELLLKHGADVNVRDEYGKTALHFTAEDRSESAPYEVPPEDFSYTELSKMFPRDELSKCFPHEELFEMYPYEERYKLFTFMNKELRGEIAELLLSKGANVDARTEDGETEDSETEDGENEDSETTLHIASREGYAKVVEALLKYNADVNSRTGVYSYTPLHLSVENRHEEISMLLLNKGADVNAKQNDGTTALHIAAKDDHNELVKMLLNRGADIDSRDKYGRTPLHIASQNRSPLHITNKLTCYEAVVTLLKYGADINITSNENHTPLDDAHDTISRYSLNRDFDEDNLDIPTSFYEVVYALEHHILKMRVAELYVSEKNVLQTQIIWFCSEMKNKCEKEISCMKSEKIGNLNISFYDILAKGANTIASYMSNENVVQVLKSVDYKTKFPMYASMIECNFRKGMERKELLEQGNKLFHTVFSNLPELPYDCTKKISSYLSNGDLRTVMAACETPSNMVSGGGRYRPGGGSGSSINWIPVLGDII